jgi:hypothetical protein
MQNLILSLIKAKSIGDSGLEHRRQMSLLSPLVKNPT